MLIKPPQSVAEIFERKERARSRFDKMSLIDKMEMALRLYHERAELTRCRPVSHVASKDAQE